MEPRRDLEGPSHALPQGLSDLWALGLMFAEAERRHVSGFCSPLKSPTPKFKSEKSQFNAGLVVSFTDMLTDEEPPNRRVKQFINCFSFAPGSSTAPHPFSTVHPPGPFSHL